ncbi:MAG: hypothetical protein EBT03_10070 [Betaproteobacteria bacterium]|nr:hypothetical protein [Betaproteobacteria bacterium]NCA17401.1 hypothetical protein [Betaproteobacteria bacterium]
MRKAGGKAVAFAWYPIVVLSPVFALATNCVTHVAVARMSRNKSPYRTIVRSAIAGLVVVVALTLLGCDQLPLMRHDVVAYLVLNIAAYLALSFDYFSFVNLCLTSLRIRMLREIYNAGGSLAGDHLGRLYDDRSLTTLRIDRLVRGGHLVLQNGRLYSQRSIFLKIAKLFEWLRWFVLGPTADH